MDEYIKRTDAYNAILDELVGTGYQSGALRAIEFIPTADVVPRAELAEALATIEKYEKTIDNGVETCNGCHAKYAEKIRAAKAEVAREIFAELERTSMFADYDTDGERILCFYAQEYDDLKKKYTEGQTDATNQN